MVNKDLLTQVDVLVALRVTAPQDRDAIREWVRGQGDEETWSQIAPSLPGLANGQSWWWLPEKGILTQVQVRQTRTFDSSPTRTRGDSSRAPKTFADVDLAAISDRIASTIERTRSTDPRALIQRIRELERALADQADQAPSPAEPEHVSVFDEAMVARLEHAVDSFRDCRALMDATTTGALEQIERVLEQSREHTCLVDETLTAVTTALETAQAAPAKTSPRPGLTPTPEGPGQSRSRDAAITPAAPPAPGPAVPEGGELSPARRRLIEALVSMEAIGLAPARKTQLALWAGVSPRSSGFANNLGGLRTSHLMDYPSPGRVALTDAGRDAAGPADVAHTDADLHQKARTLVSPARWRILAALIETYPDALSRDDLAAAAGVQATSSGFANNLGALRSLGLVDYPAPGHVAATNVLFVPKV